MIVSTKEFRLCYIVFTVMHVYGVNKTYDKAGKAVIIGLK